MDKLNLGEQFIKDESIVEYEFIKHTAETSGSDLDNNKTVRFKINNQNVFLDISESYLEIKGELVRNRKGVESVFDKEDKVTLVNNGIMFLYNSIIYKLDQHIIEQIDNPGESSTIMGYLTYPENYKNTKGLNQMWYPDSNADFSKDGFKIRHDYLFEKPADTGSFSLVIPLKHIFGFCKTYEKVLYGFEHSLELQRKTGDDDAIIAHYKVEKTKDGVTYSKEMTKDAHIKITDLNWFIPHVKPNLEVETKLLSQIKNKNDYEVLYKRFQCQKTNVPFGSVFDWRLTTSTSGEKVRFVIIAFQLTPQNVDKEYLDTAKFYNANLRNIYVSLNNRRYPYEQYDMNFKNNDFARMFNEAVSFKKKCFNDESSVNITPFNYRRNHPIFVIDTSNQYDNIKGGIVDITVHMEFSQTSTNLSVVSVLVSDRIIKFEADGSKMRVIQ